MGIRVTEIRTPFGGLAWEYTDKNNMPATPPLATGRKINVFVSSKCGDKGKYDHVRAELKKSIEATNIADVYLFEDEGASSVPAGLHYGYALEDSDVCIFLIDNADGIPSGVQKEIDIVKKHEIKSLCYFCDEQSKEKTAFEQSIMGAKYAKSYSVHKFDDLIQNGAQDLIDEIVAIYHHYCKGRLSWNDEVSTDEMQPVSIIEVEKSVLPVIPKAVIKSIDKCSTYMLKLVLGYAPARLPDHKESTCEFDEWCAQFLPVLFEGASIKQFNTTLFLEVLKTQQANEHFQVVESRWKALQSYFMGDLDKCVNQLWESLKLAKETEQPQWLVKDILIDLRNLHWKQCAAKNCYSDSEAQKELTESTEEVFYPLLDRVNESLQEKYISGLYKKKTESPYTITLGGDLDQYGQMLASSYVIAMYNGSLSHILMLFDKIRDFTFYLSCKYSDWRLRRGLFKFAVFSGKEKEIDGVQNSYPEVLNKLSAEDATQIMSFCNNHPLEHERFISQMLGFGAVGYYLSDEGYKQYESLITSRIEDWLNSETHITTVGQTIFRCLTGIGYRMSQDYLANICCIFIDKHYSRYYMDMFKFIRKRLDIRKMSADVVDNFLLHIVSVISNEQERELIKYAPEFLCSLRKQDRLLTQELDQAIAKYLPDFYNGNYKLETTENNRDYTVFIEECVKKINDDNKTQGENGRFFVRGSHDAATIRNIICWNEIEIDPILIDSIILAVSNTLLHAKESVGEKLNAVSLLISIVQKYPTDYHRNADKYQKIYERKDAIESAEYSAYLSNVDNISLKIGLCFLFEAMGIDSYPEILELIPYLQDDIATTLSVAHFIEKYLEASDKITLSSPINAIVLQSILQWLRSENLDLRCVAVRVLIMLIRNPENENMVNRQIMHLIDSECVYIKNYIMRRIYDIVGISDETREYVVSKCENDACYVVRLVCAECKRTDK